MIDATRDVVRHVHRTREAAERQVGQWIRRAPDNAIVDLMYCVREVTANTKVGDRLPQLACRTLADELAQISKDEFYRRCYEAQMRG